MNYLTSAFDDLGLSYIPSVGNFISFRVPDGIDAMGVYSGLLKQGVIVRPVANYEMPGYLRVSIGTESENETFIRALQKVLA
jgi:histidinol-phosphate aminotransferase